MRFAVVSPMRDEGAHIVEWVCWYRMLGFTDILILTHDCTDHSPALLDAFADAGWLTHVRYRPPRGRPPGRSAFRKAKQHRAVVNADWILICDVDEFLVIHAGGGRITDLITEPEPDYLGIAINWRIFGHGHQDVWSDGLTHRQFRCAAQSDNNINSWQKSIFRRPDLFGSFGSHGPYRLVLDAGVEWGSAPWRWVDTLGRQIETWGRGQPYLRWTPPGQLTHEVAQMNHYILRSRESFNAKQGSLSLSALADRYTPEFRRRFDRNAVEDLSALGYKKVFDLIHAEAMVLPGIRGLHHLCCADYIAHLLSKTGTDPRFDTRWQHHMAAAG